MEKHRIGKDGLREDGVRTYAADAHDMALFDEAKSSLRGFSAPKLTSASESNRKVFIAAFDGTGNDAIGDREHLTNVGSIKDQIDMAVRGGRDDISVGYVEGVGTQRNPIQRAIDSASGHTYDERIEEMYSQFIRKAAEWKAENPDVQISIASIGFSRGAEQAAGFTRLVHERGIQDWTGEQRVAGPGGKIAPVYTKDPLVPPGQTAQVVGLFDPVGTGSPREYDRRLPPSVISGFQLTSEDERRSAFKSTRLLDMGASPDGRFLNVWVPGAHSDVGGGYHRNGLSLRSGNLMIDYLNTLSDRPFLRKQAEPSDPAMNVVHRSEEGMLMYRVWRRVDRREASGTVEELAPRRVNGERVEGNRFDAQPRDEALARRFGFRNVEIGPVPVEPAPRRAAEATGEPPPARDATQPGDPGHARLVRSAEAVAVLDRELGLEGLPDRNLIARDRMAAFVASVAERNDLRPDRVVLGQGDTAFVVEDSSAGRRIARFDVREATATPVGDSLDRIGEATLARAQQAPSTNALLAGQDAVRTRAPAMA